MDQSAELAEWIKAASTCVVFTGAGMSTESGLPDFRSQRGLWSGQDPTKLASTHSMHHNRQAFIEFYRMRIEGLLSCLPHAGHELLAGWETRGLIRGIITQNVDGFHQRAGSESVAELHGTLATVRCSLCQNERPSETYLAAEGTHCQCGGFMRPSVVLFGESLPQTALEQAEEWTNEADLFIVFGSSLVVSPANFFPQQAKENGAKLVIVNREPTPLDGWADMVIQDMLIGSLLQETDKILNL
ncbi:NAD-dependent deacetylase [Brevibacillus choshinensis]|uniref:protein acetyllysine N-acetyltransferase n=1 Tax=Brevibacillus choshinensis TaxID=54911 RepID=A0ABR5NC01_BRECH|nr:NAD-dependent deacylase [Brevibacillus choshinensis]KQL48899.1 NAD-dependent deacetylase [Brevibacillus choshinensis]